MEKRVISLVGWWPVVRGSEPECHLGGLTLVEKCGGSDKYISSGTAELKGVVDVGCGFGLLGAVFVHVLKLHHS